MHVAENEQFRTGTIRINGISDYMGSCAAQNTLKNT